MKSNKLTFSKSEKLCSLLLIESLFKSKLSIKSFPLVLFWQTNETLINNQVLLTVSKKKFKLATDRNRIKRQMREAYRLNKQIISTSDKFYLLGITYISPNKLSYMEIDAAMKKVFNKFNNES